MLELNTIDAPQAAAAEDALPAWTWPQLQAMLERIAATPMQRDMAQSLVSATRKQAAFLPPEHVLLEILCLACFIADEGTLSRAGRRPIQET